jgi:hypothetical protein
VSCLGWWNVLEVAVGIVIGGVINWGFSRRASKELKRCPRLVARSPGPMIARSRLGVPTISSALRTPSPSSMMMLASTSSSATCR